MLKLSLKENASSCAKAILHERTLLLCLCGISDGDVENVETAEGVKL